MDVRAFFLLATMAAISLACLRMNPTMTGGACAGLEDGVDDCSVEFPGSRCVPAMQSGSSATCMSPQRLYYATTASGSGAALSVACDRQMMQWIIIPRRGSPITIKKFKVACIP